MLAADAATSWGLLPAGIVIDELAWWSDVPEARALFDSLSSSAAKVAACRLIVITSPSAPGHFAHKIYETACIDPLWRVSEQVGAPPWLDPAKVEEQRRRLAPSMFARLFEGVWADADDQLTSLEALRACVTHDGPLAFEPQRAPYMLALDLGVKRDRTVAVVCHRAGERVILDRLAVWQGSRRQPVQLEAVEAWIEDASRQYGSAKVVCDPWQTIGMAQRLRSRGVQVAEFQFTAQSVGRLASTLYGALRDTRLGLPDNEELLDELLHVRLRETAPGVWRLDHDSGRHDDRAIALALATYHLLERPVVSSSAPWMGRKIPHAAGLANVQLEAPAARSAGVTHPGQPWLDTPEPEPEPVRPSLVVRRSRPNFRMPPGGPPR